MDYKKLIKIISIVLILTAIGVGGYYLWSWLNSNGGIAELISGGKAPTTEVIETGTEGEAETGTETGADVETQQPETVTQKLSILINSPVFEYWLGSQDNSLYFVNLNGQIIKINSDGTRRLVSSQSLNNLHKITPSTDGSLAIAEFNYPALPNLSIFSASSTSWQPLPSGTISAAFSPDSKKIVYTDQSSIRQLDWATQKTTEIQKMSQVGLELGWLKNNDVLLNTEPSVESRGYLYVFNITNKTINTLIDGEYGLDINWAKDGNLGIKLNSVEKNPRLSLVDGSAKLVANFTFLTVPEKCVIETSKIYCGVPKNIKSGIVLPDDYYKNKEYFIDDIYELDLPTGAITKLFDGSEVALDAKNLKVKDNALLFINRYDNKVYSLNLN